MERQAAVETNSGRDRHERNPAEEGVGKEETHRWGQRTLGLYGKEFLSGTYLFV